jgi:hypothetical protein
MVEVLAHEHIIATPIPRLLLGLVQLPEELSANAYIFQKANV